jgi:DNA-nicking Smr family endonuclease
VPPRPRTLSAQDRRDWAVYAHAVTALPGRTLPDVPPPEPAVPQPRPAVAPLPQPARAPAQALGIGEQPAGLDRAYWQRLRAGRLAPARTLDLHGHTANRAFDMLHAFLILAHADRVRCVEVITGRGAGEAGGVIRRELPLWLNLPALRPLVLAASHPHPANQGAVRLLLRRPR